MQLIENILGKKNNIKVLRHLIKHKNWQFNITELAKDIYINKGVLSRLIDDLEKENVIRVSKKGKIKLFSINKENLFIKKTIIPLFEKEDILVDNLVDDIINIIKIVKERQQKEVTKAFIYVFPKEKELYLENLGSIKKRINIELKISAVNDSDKYDPQNKAGKTKVGKPAIYLE